MCIRDRDILGRKKNVVIEEESARKLFGTENAVGKTFRTTVYGDTDMYTVCLFYTSSFTRLKCFESHFLRTSSPSETFERIVRHSNK